MTQSGRFIARCGHASGLIHCDLSKPLPTFQRSLNVSRAAVHSVQWLCVKDLNQGERSYAHLYLPRSFHHRRNQGQVAKPENREKAVSNLFESVGGRLIGWYLTFGPHDWLVIGEFPNDRAVASAILAAAAGGSLSDIETTVAMTAEDARATFEAAGTAAKAFRSAGRS
jgi:uncharacterized protein with GYD domain